MLPNGVLSDQVIYAPFIPPRDIYPTPLVDYELGGVALNDSSQGLQVKVWHGVYTKGSIVFDAPGVDPTVIYTASGITEFSMTFDQNMQPFLAYVQNKIARFRWYDTTVNQFVVVDLPAGSITPKCCLDDKRSRETPSSDILLFYVNNGNLYYRQQRDRFTIEYLLKTGVGGTLKQVGMNLVNRMQLILEVG